MKHNYSACNLILFLLVVLAVLFFGCEKKCNCETIQEAVKLLEHCDSVTVEARQYSYGDNDSIEWPKTKVSYKVEYKRHVAMIDSICGDKEQCAGSLGFAEYFNQHDPSEPHRVKDLFHKDILITIP
jgi:hypothetical protein